MNSNCAATTSVIDVRKTNVPMALTCGSMLPVTISRMITGMVLLRPETNQAMANSSNETAAHRHKAEMMAGLQNGSTTWRMVAHSEAPRFHAAASRFSSIWFNLNRIIAMANGAVSTVWAAMMDQTSPDAPMRENQASMARAMMISGMVGGSRMRAR